MRHWQIRALPLILTFTQVLPCISNRTENLIYMRYLDLHVRRTPEEICERFLEQVSAAISKNDLGTVVDLFHSDGWLQK